MAEKGGKSQIKEMGQCSKKKDKKTIKIATYKNTLDL